MGLIINARIKRVVYAEKYKDPQHDGDKARWALEAAAKLGIAMVHIEVPKLYHVGVDMAKVD
jgi:deoxycytidylate deaminase